MSRSNPTEAARNPSTRWFEFAGGSDGGFVRYYDKETKQTVPLGDDQNGSNFLFVYLDELSTVSGWNEQSESAIFANEVRDTRQDTFVVRSFKGGELATGLYGSIKDRISAVGGYYVTSCYLAYKDGDELKIGNLRLKGASLSAWMDFKKQCPTKKDATGRSVKAYYVDAVKIRGFTEGTKGKVTFRVPSFALVPLSESTNKQAMELDAELQAFLSDYLKRPRMEAAAASAKASAPPEEEHPAVDDDPYPTPPVQRTDHRQDYGQQNGRSGLPDQTPVAKRDLRAEQRQRNAASSSSPFTEEEVFTDAEIPF